MKMRRIAACLLTLMLTLSVLSVAAFAAEKSDGEIPYVTDTARLLTEEQMVDLEKRCQEISARYEFSVYIMVVDNYLNYRNTGDLFDFAVAVYDGYQLGWGSSREGTSLVLSMADRDYCLHFNSTRADAVFTEVGRDWMEDRFLAYFRNNDFYGGFREYLNCCEEYLEAAQNGNPVGANVSEYTTYTEEKTGIGALAAIPGAIAAFLTGLIAKAPMRSAVKQTNANAYVADGNLHLTQRSDQFVNRTVTRRPRQTNTNRSGGGGGSIHHSSGSHSGRSGKF